MCSYEERKLFKFQAASLSESFIKITTHLSNWCWRKQTHGPKRSQNDKYWELYSAEQRTDFAGVWGQEGLAEGLVTPLNFNMILDWDEKRIPAI